MSKKVVVVTGLSKTATGRVRKNELRDEFRYRPMDAGDQGTEGADETR